MRVFDLVLGSEVDLPKEIEPGRFSPTDFNCLERKN
jgi:hypothetical protein